MFTKAQQWLLFTSIIQEGLLKMKPRHMASLMAMFPNIMFILHSVTYNMLDKVLEMTFFNSLTCLTPGQQFIKSCLKFLSRNR
jgi:hypothetical protein